MLITHSEWTNPPKAVGPINDHNAMAELFPQPFRVTNFDEEAVDPFWTYGIWVTNETAIEAQLDAALVMILVRCLAADPADRPSLRELLRWARWRQIQPDWNEGQDDLRAWSDEHISQPPVVSKKSSNTLLLSNIDPLTPRPRWQKAHSSGTFKYSERPRRRRSRCHGSSHRSGGNVTHQRVGKQSGQTRAAPAASCCTRGELEAEIPGAGK